MRIHRHECRFVRVSILRMSWNNRTWSIPPYSHTQDSLAYTHTHNVSTMKHTRADNIWWFRSIGVLGRVRIRFFFIVVVLIGQLIIDARREIFYFLSIIFLLSCSYFILKISIVVFISDIQCIGKSPFYLLCACVCYVMVEHRRISKSNKKNQTDWCDDGLIN